MTILKNLIKILFSIMLSINTTHAEIIEMIPQEMIQDLPIQEVTNNSQQDKPKNRKDNHTRTDNQKVNSSNKNDFILKIGTIPKNASIRCLNNKKLHYRWAMKLKPNKYKFLISKAGYQSKEITINLDRDLYKRIQLRRQKYTLKIVPNVKNSKIKILNIAPKYKKNIRLNANIKYEILVSKKGYKDKLFTTTLKKNTVLKVKLLKEVIKRKYYSLRIVPNVANTTIKIKNIRTKYKPNIRLEKGAYEITVNKEGYKERRFRTYLKKNEIIQVRLNKIKPKYCTLRIEPNVSRAIIKIKDIKTKYRPRVPLTCKKRYKIEVSKKGYKTRTFWTHLTHSEVIPVNLRKK